MTEGLETVDVAGVGTISCGRCLIGDGEGEVCMFRGGDALEEENAGKMVCAEVGGGVESGEWDTGELEAGAVGGADSAGGVALPW